MLSEVWLRNSTWPRVGPVWEQLRPKLRSTWAQYSSTRSVIHAQKTWDIPVKTGAQPQLGPKLSRVGALEGSLFWVNFADSVRHAENLHVCCYFQCFLGGSCKAMLPTLGLSCAQLPHVKHNLRPNVPTLRQVGPQLDPKLEPTGPSSAQVSRGLLFGPTEGQERPCLTPVGFGWAKYARSFPSQSDSLGAGGSRREATRIPNKYINSI
jgi:hypothetical protein